MFIIGAAGTLFLVPARRLNLTRPFPFDLINAEGWREVYDKPAWSTFKFFPFHSLHVKLLATISCVPYVRIPPVEFPLQLLEVIML